MPILVVLVIIIILLVFCHLVAKYAESLNRNYLIWFIISVIFNPIFSYIFLLISGRSYEGTLRQEEINRIKEAHPEIENVRDPSMEYAKCTECGNRVNVATKDGLTSKDDEPWRLFCTACNSEFKAN